ELPHRHEPLRLRIVDNGSGFNIVPASDVAQGPDGRHDRGLGLWLIRQATRGLRQTRNMSGENETILDF
ncbi:MAG TPA: hypothetical protein VNZ67_07640, partial [bacterium]|nr:hypothetical protein [bacterium]